MEAPRHNPIGPSTLTPRHLDILRAIAGGETTIAGVANRLGVASDTIKVQLYDAGLGLRSRLKMPKGRYGLEEYIKKAKELNISLEEE